MSVIRTASGRYRCETPDDTAQLGELMAPALTDGDVLILTGGLGAGKTQLTRGLARGLGDGHPVTSPTFALMAVHDGGRLPLFHFDLYRLTHAYELEDTGIYDVLGYEGVCALEWGEQFQDELTDEYLGVQLERVEGCDVREVSLHPHGTRAEALAQAIDARVTCGGVAAQPAESADNE